MVIGKSDHPGERITVGAALTNMLLTIVWSWIGAAIGGFIYRFVCAEDDGDNDLEDGSQDDSPAVTRQTAKPPVAKKAPAAAAASVGV